MKRKTKKFGGCLMSLVKLVIFLLALYGLFSALLTFGLI